MKLTIFLKLYKVDTSEEATFFYFKSVNQPSIDIVSVRIKTADAPVLRPGSVYAFTTDVSDTNK